MLTSDKPELEFRPALPADAARIAALVNIAYRGETSRLGWTTEADLLDGLRTSVAEVVGLIAAENSVLLLCLHESTLLGSLCLEYMGEHVHLGMFVVDPAQQNRGLGKRLLAYAEQVAQQRWKPHKMALAVITRRHELITFYQRRGYRRTGIHQQFPLNPALWQPKVAGLQFEIMEKPLLTAA